MRIRRIVDLSVPLDESTQVYPGDPTLRVRPHSTISRDGFNLLRLELGSQTGTHVDAPYHFRDDGARIDDLDLTLFAGPAVVLDARGTPARGGITWDRVEAAASTVQPGTIALLQTGWASRFGTPGYLDHPFLDAGACRRLLDLGIRTFCLDALSIDETPVEGHPGEGFPAHHLIAEAGGVIGENFRNLDLIGPQPFVCCFPIALSAADGAPVRAVAIEWEAA